MTMARSLTSLVNLVLATMVFFGCKQHDVAVAHKCQLLVVLDKTNSVSYVNARRHIQEELHRRFVETYANATKDIKSSLLVITGSTSVFPEWCRFGKDMPEGDEDSRAYQQRLLQWKTEKRIWLAERVKDIGSRIDGRCGSNTTDIFSIFNGIGQVKKEAGDGDSVMVIIFSDMVNTCGKMNMLSKEMTMDNARENGKNVCSAMKRNGEMSGTENLDLTIYTPDGAENSRKVKLFWDGFFEEWGLKPGQYHFE